MPLKKILLLPVLALLCACHSESEKAGPPSRQPSPVASGEHAKPPETKPQQKPAPATPGFHYTALPLKKNDTAIGYFKKHFSDAEKKIIYALNRIDANNLWRPDTLVIPDTFYTDWLAYSPFPRHLPILDSVNKIVLFSYPVQAFAAYKNGVLERWGPTSMGAKIHPTPTGLHFANWKSKKSVSTVKDEWILPWNFNIVNKGGVGWHEYSMPGYPASHSCLRLHAEDAEWLYYWANQWILIDDQHIAAQGTPVIVYGAYPWGTRRPWRYLLENPEANAISPEALEKEITPYLPRILEAQQTREQVEAERNGGRPQPDTSAASAGPGASVSR